MPILTRLVRVGRTRINRTARERNSAVFVERGIDAERIKTVAHGEDRPVKSNDNEINRQINRRVIVQLIKPSSIEL